MATESIGAYSRDTVYGRLTAPFVYDQNGRNAQKVHINAHTPLDEPQVQKTVTQSDYRLQLSSEKLFHINDFNSIEAIGIGNENASQIGILKNPAEIEIPPKLVSSFSKSSLSSSNSNIVYNALNNGYSTSQAVTIAKAQKAYSQSLGNVTASPANVLGSRKFV